MELNPSHALVVFSGGQDSTTCLGYALDTYDEVSTVTFDYGQKHAREIEAAFEVIKFFRVKTGRNIHREVIALGPHVFAGTSPLTNQHEDLETYDNHLEMELEIGDRIEKTFVPMRNAVFLMLAANRAAVLGAGILVTGVCQADNANYPDCREIFVQNAELAINTALGLDVLSVPNQMRVQSEAIFNPNPEYTAQHDRHQMNLDTPLINLSKAESIRMALSLPHTYSALAYSHTAYDGNYPPTGKDHASILRAHGFEEAGVADPLVVRAWREGLMPLPESPNYDLVRSLGDAAQRSGYQEPVQPQLGAPQDDKLDLA